MMRFLILQVCMLLLLWNSQAFSSLSATTQYLASLSPSRTIDETIEHSRESSFDEHTLDDDYFIEDDVKDDPQNFWNDHDNYADDETLFGAEYDDETSVEEYLLWLSSFETGEPFQVEEDDALSFQVDDDDDEHCTAENVVGTMLRPCCGRFCTFFGEGPDAHLEDSLVVCCEISEEFLESNHGDCLRDLSINVGDVGCLAICQWVDAYNDGVAPPIFLEATHASTLEEIDLDFLRAYALDHDVALERMQELNLAKLKLKQLMEEPKGFE